MPLFRASLLVVCATVVLVYPVMAQEPAPSRLRWSMFESGEEIAMTLAWKFSAGDDARSRLPALDDSAWETVDPRSYRDNSMAMMLPSLLP